jgi:hypothetical protein
MNKSFDIIEKSRKARTIKILALIIPLMLIATLIYLISKFGTSPLMIILIIISFIIIFINPFVLSNTKKIGELLFMTDFISILGLKIEIQDIQKMSIVINNYFFDRQGSPITGIGNTSSLHGNTNKIMIKTQNDIISYSFHIKYSKDIRTVKQILENYKSKGVNIIFHKRNRRLI